MDELEIYKNKAMRLEKALRQITDIRWRSYDCMLSTAKCALEEEVRIEEERGLTSRALDEKLAWLCDCGFKHIAVYDGFVCLCGNVFRQ